MTTKNPNKFEDSAVALSQLVRQQVSGYTYAPDLNTVLINFTDGSAIEFSTESELTVRWVQAVTVNTRVKDLESRVKELEKRLEAEKNDG